MNRQTPHSPLVRASLGLFVMMLVVATASGRTDYPEDELPYCESTPLEWCSFVTAVICQPISTNKCAHSDPMDPYGAGVTWPADITDGDFANTYYYYINNNTDSVQLTNGSGFINFTIGSYHDSCRVVYRASDFEYDGSRLDFSSWDHAVLHDDWTEAQLADNTVSDVFTLSTGKKIEFYREFSWAHPSSGEQTTTNYMSLDTLAYTIELVRDSDDSRLAVLDTMSALRRTTPGAPSLYGANAILAAIEYEVPSSMNNVDAYIRIVPTARGTGSYKFGRLDYSGWELSDKPNTTEGSSYITTYGPGMPKAVRTWQQMAHSQFSEYKIDPLAIAADRIGLFEITGGDLEKLDAFVVTNAAGYSNSSEVRIVSRDEDRILVEVDFASSGAYFVAAFSGPTTLSVKKIAIH